MFPRLLELIRGRVDDEVGLYKMLLELLYEMSRIQRLRLEDLSQSLTRWLGGPLLKQFSSANRGRFHCMFISNYRGAVRRRQRPLSLPCNKGIGMCSRHFSHQMLCLRARQLVLNEQYMVSAHDPGPGESPAIPLTNKVIKILSSQGSALKTFGENLILLLNRESTFSTLFSCHALHRGLY